MKAVLSNTEILQLYGKEIMVYPFDPANMDGGATYNLTASRFAYYINYAKKDDPTKNPAYIYAVNCDDQIIIPPNVTILIQTEESILVGKHICGTYHSKVTLACKGLSHIGTTLDPDYFGTSLIAIHNNSGIEQKIKIGATFASLMFYRTNKPALPRHDNMAGRYDIVPVDEDRLTFNCSENDIVKRQKEELAIWRGEKFRTSRNVLTEKCLQRRKELLSERNRKRLRNISNVISMSIGGISLIIVLLHLIFGNKISFIDKLLTDKAGSAIIIFICSMLILVKDKAVSIVEQYCVTHENNKGGECK